MNFFRAGMETRPCGVVNVCDTTRMFKNGQERIIYGLIHGRSWLFLVRRRHVIPCGRSTPRPYLWGDHRPQGRPSLIPMFLRHRTLRPQGRPSLIPMFLRHRTHRPQGRPSLIPMFLRHRTHRPQGRHSLILMFLRHRTLRPQGRHSLILMFLRHRTLRPQGRHSLIPMFLRHRTHRPQGRTKKGGCPEGHPPEVKKREVRNEQKKPLAKPMTKTKTWNNSKAKTSYHGFTLHRR